MYRLPNIITGEVKYLIEEPVEGWNETIFGEKILLYPSGNFLTDRQGSYWAGGAVLDYTYLLRLEAENARRNLVTANGDAQLDGDGAVTFDGTGDWVDVDNMDSDHTQFSAECYFKLGALGAFQMIFGKYNLDASGSWMVRMKDTNVVQAWTVVGGVPASSDGTTVLTTGVWYHLRIVYDGANVKTYLNGTLEASHAETGTLANPSEPFSIGRRSNNAIQYLTGSVSRVNYRLDIMNTGNFTAPARTDAITVDEFTVLALDFAGTATSTRILDSAKPSYAIDASDTFDGTRNIQRWPTIWSVGNGSINQSGGVVSISLDAESGNLRGYQSGTVVLDGDYTIECKWSNLVFNSPTNSSACTLALYDGVTSKATMSYGYLAGGFKARGSGFGGLFQNDSSMGTVATIYARIVRSGTTNTAQWSTNGTDWTTLWTETSSDSVNQIRFYMDHGTETKASSGDCEYVTALSGATPIQITTDTGACPILPDISGNEYDATQATVANEPLFDPVKQALTFDGTNDYYDVAPAQAQPFTIYLVVDATVTFGAEQNIIGSANVTVALDSGGNSFQANAGTLLDSGFSASGSKKVLAAVCDGANGEVWMDGTLRASGNIGTNALAAFFLGVSSGKTFPFNGDLYACYVLAGGYNEFFNSTISSKYGV